MKKTVLPIGPFHPIQEEPECFQLVLGDGLAVRVLKEFGIDDGQVQVEVSAVLGIGHLHALFIRASYELHRGEPVLHLCNGVVDAFGIVFFGWIVIAYEGLTAGPSAARSQQEQSGSHQVDKDASPAYFAVLIHSHTVLV